MSEKDCVLASKTFLQVCMGIEGLCAELYHYYSEAYKDDPEASHLWKKTAMEEENHQLQFKLALSLMDEAEFEVPKDSLKRAFSIQYKLLQLMGYVKRNKQELLMAISMAVEMENKLADLHACTALKFKEESLQKLFKAMGESDQGHVTDLQHYRTILALPLSEMKE